MQIEVLIRRIRLVAGSACSVLLFLVLAGPAVAQEPPLDVPLRSLPARDPNAIVVGGWRLYPTLRIYSLYSDNLFLSSVSPLSVPGFGITPSMAAEWTNGIHTTTLYGNLDRQAYPTANEVNTLDGRAGFSQRYEAMRDLIFTVNGNYSHKTWASGLQDSIQTAALAPTTTVLPNGNTVLPNGTIISQSGQVVGQTSPTLGSNVQLAVNPSNQYSGTFSIDKIFNRGILSLSETVSRTDYESQVLLKDTSSRTFSENAAFWLSPLFYAYSSGVVSTVATSATSSSTTSYRVLGGLGSRQFGLWRGSVYFGHQGSRTSNTSAGAPNTISAGGDIYGASISYYPTPQLTFKGTVDRTTNISSGTSVTDLALSLPNFSAVQVPLTASTHIISASLRTDYEIAPLWFAGCQLGYVRIEYVGSPRLDNSWLLDATLRYDVWRDMSIAWQYRYRSIISNAPLASANSNFVMMGTTYRF